jgi:hypothetical protein
MNLTKQQVKSILSNAPEGSDPNKVVEALIDNGYIIEGLNDQPQPEQKGFLKTVASDVAETLLVKPAARVAEVVGRTGILGEDIKRGYETMADEGTSQQFNVPGLNKLTGTIDVEAQKGGMEGRKQIAGEALKIGSFLFPYGRVAGMASKTLGKIGSNVASGATGGYMADVGYNLEQGKTIGESLKPGLGTVLGGAIPVGGALLGGARKVLKTPKPTTEETIGKILQGKTDDIPLGNKALSSIDTTGVKTRQELSDRLKTAMQNQMDIVDSELLKDPRALSLDSYAVRVKNNAGQEVKTDYITEAFKDLDEFYSKNGDQVSRSNLQLLYQKATQEGLTHQEVNNIARLYSEEFGAKAFNKLGDPLTSVTAQKFENVRSGLKQNARGGLGFGKEAQEADRLYYAMENTKKLIDKGVEGVNRLQQRIKSRNLLEKIGRSTTNAINALSGGFLKGAASSVFPSNVGLKTLNWLDLERSLANDLKFIEKANSLKSDSALIKFLKENINRLKFPGDAFLETNLGKKAIKYAKNPKVGMSIQDVSKIAKSLKVKGEIPKTTLPSSISKAKASGQSFDEWVKGQGENNWSKLQKTNPDLFNTGILRKSQAPYKAVGEIPQDIHTIQGKWQNYGQYDEIPADVIYKRIESGSFKGEYEDALGNAVRDKNGDILRDTYNDATGEWIKPNVSNQELRDTLLKHFETPQGKEYLNKVITALPKNADGSITAYRIGAIGKDGAQSYTLSEGMAKTFSNQGTDVLPAGTPGLPTGGYKDFGSLPVNTVKINPKGIKAWSPYDAEILVEPKFVKTRSQLKAEWDKIK